MVVYTYELNDATYFIRHDRVVPTLTPTAPMNPAKKPEEMTYPWKSPPSPHFSFFWR